jgi:hypothetical protein
MICYQFPIKDKVHKTFKNFVFLVKTFMKYGNFYNQAYQRQQIKNH